MPQSLPSTLHRVCSSQECLLICRPSRYVANVSTWDGAQKPQLHETLRKSQLLALNGIENPSNRGLVHLHETNINRLDGFGSLGLGRDQKRLKQNARQTRKRRESKARQSDVEQGERQALAVPGQRTSHGSLCYESSLNTIQHQPGQGFVPLLQNPCPLQYERRKLRPFLKPFVLQSMPLSARESTINAIAQIQKRTLSIFKSGSRSVCSAHSIKSTQRLIPPIPNPFSTLSLQHEKWDHDAKNRRLKFTEKWDRKRRADKLWGALGESDPYKTLPQAKNTYAENSFSLYKTKSDPIHQPAPEPAEAYLAEASAPPVRLSSPQKLLLVNDLKGTLIHRALQRREAVLRPGIGAFLDYGFQRHSMMIWSTITPSHLLSLCQQTFTSAQHDRLLGVWDRSHFGLTPENYGQRVQTYKNLENIWASETIQSQHPEYATGGRWGQHNTLLIDDDAVKAAAQPFNHIEIPEFTEHSQEDIRENGVLATVIEIVEEASGWNNVSAFLKTKRQGSAVKALQW